MSRTYRKHLVHEYKIRGRYYSDKETNELWDLQSGIWYFSGKRERIDKKSRDRKPWYKPSHEFKKMNRRWERFQVKQALRNNKEIIPTFKKYDMWEWT